MNCEKCGTRIQGEASLCAECNAKLETRSKAPESWFRKNRIWLIAFGSGFVLQLLKDIVNPYLDPDQMFWRAVIGGVVVLVVVLVVQFVRFLLSGF